MWSIQARTHLVAFRVGRGSRGELCRSSARKRGNRFRNHVRQHEVEHRGDAHQNHPEVHGGVPYPPRQAAPRREQADYEAEHYERDAAHEEKRRPSLVEGLEIVHPRGLSHIPGGVYPSRGLSSSVFTRYAPNVVGLVTSVRWRWRGLRFASLLKPAADQQVQSPNDCQDTYHR
jgi:hypothetical protein